MDHTPLFIARSCGTMLVEKKEARDGAEGAVLEAGARCPLARSGGMVVRRTPATSDPVARGSEGLRVFFSPLVLGKRL